MTASRTRPERLWHRPFRRSDPRCAASESLAARLPALTDGPSRVARPHPHPNPHPHHPNPQPHPQHGPADRVPDAPSRLSLPDGTVLLLRPAGPADKAAALAMHDRCSPAALRLRYHGPVRDADRYLDHLLDARHGRSLAVAAPDGRILALGHLMWDDGEAELAVLVEDAWQRQGLGQALLRRLSATARATGIGTVYAVTHAANSGLIAAMRRLAAPLDFRAEDGTLVITATLGAEDPAARTHHPSR
ncbi:MULTISPECIES: GNAT family N-acetyltransferase [unclassified Kitasatospora]|uniref:GNAT family N-acetyltransferase n=1 Tax=unclassified Kitasatospora TaxID=2633591 RepID=UPI0033D40739